MSAAHQNHCKIATTARTAQTKTKAESVMNDGAEPKPLIPALQPFYRAVEPWTWPLVRVAVGWGLIVHGYGKILRGPEQQAAMLTRDGLIYPYFFALFLTFIEFVGGVCISAGLVTCF